MKDWSKPAVTEGRTQITLRVDFDLYAKLHALKAVYINRSVNELMNDLLISGINEIVEELGDPCSGGEEIFDQNNQYVGTSSENSAYFFDRTYSIILNEGKDSSLLKESHLKDAE